MRQLAAIHLEEVGSTNSWLAARADSTSDNQWVYADRQTAGRGRRGRAWLSEPGNLYTSVLVRPGTREARVEQLSFVAAVSLDEALQAWVPAERLAIKWPNDILLDRVKCAGILPEAERGVVVVGFGVNLARAPDDTERPATSLAAAGCAVPTPAEALAALAEAFARWRGIWAGDGFAGVRARWLARAGGVGETVVARLGNETLTGRFEGLGPDGALQLRLPSGTLRPVYAGEVFAPAG